MTTESNNRAGGVETDLSLLTPGERLRRQSAACKVTFRKWGVNKTLTDDQKEQVANLFNAKSKKLSAGKPLINTKNEYYRAVLAIFHSVEAEWNSRGHPYIEKGVRLFKRSEIEDFNNFILRKTAELDRAVQAMQDHRGDIVAEGMEELGDLANPADYPDTFVGRYAIEVEYPELEPPSYLEAINPNLYRAQSERVRQRFEEAVELGEALLAETLQDLVDKLVKVLTPNDDGTPRIFQASTVDNFHAFFTQARALSLGSNADLEVFIKQASDLLHANTQTGRLRLTATNLRENEGLRDGLRGKMEELSGKLQGLLVGMGRRQLGGKASANVSEAIEV